jgi:uncharacterized protein YraI
MRHLKALGLLIATLAAVPSVAHAQSAFAARDLAILAGPSTEYPEVAILPRGAAFNVQGCLSDYRWCDVIAGPYRGWAYAGNIVYPYRGSNVPLATYGAVIGIGVLAFSVGHYWDNYYVGRPWYPQRQLWINRPPSPHYGPGFRPPGGHPPPPGARPPGVRPPPPPGARPHGGHPPPDGHAPPPGARPQGVHPPQQDHRNGGGQRPQKEHNQGSR